MTRVRLEAGVAVLFAAWAAVTLFWPDWIELSIGADPDSGSGATEWGIIILLAALALAVGLLARRDFRRVRDTPATIGKSTGGMGGRP